MKEYFVAACVGVAEFLTGVFKYISTQETAKAIKRLCWVEENSSCNTSAQSLQQLRKELIVDLNNKLDSISEKFDGKLSSNNYVMVSILKEMLSLAKDNSSANNILAKLLNNDLENLNLLENLEGQFNTNFTFNQQTMLEQHRDLTVRFSDLHKDIKSVREAQEIAEAAKKFDFKVQDIQSGFSILSNSAILFGDYEFAKQMTVTGSAIASTTSIIAGLKGVGSLAGISPFAAAAGLFGAVVSVASLFSDEEDESMQILFETIQAIAQQIQTLRQEMHERFDEIMRSLGKIERELLTGLCELNNDITIFGKKIDSIKEQLTKFNTQNNYEHESLFASVKELKQSQTHIQIKNTWDQILYTIDLTKNYIIHNKDNLLEFQKLMNQLYSMLTGETFCKSSNLTGLEITKSFKENNPEAIIELLDAYQAPIVPIQTISTYQNNLNLPNDCCYTPDQIDYLMQLCGKDSNIEISKTHLLSSFILDERADSNSTGISSLSKTIKQFLNQTSSQRLFVPFLINGNYGLIVAQNNPVKFYYFGDRNEFHKIEKIIMQATKIVEYQEESNLMPLIDQVDVPAYLPKNYSALWLLNLVEIGIKLNNIKDLYSVYSNKQQPDNTAGIYFNALMPAAAYKIKHKIWQKSLNENLKLLVKPVSPLIWHIAVYDYLELFTKKLFIHHPAENPQQTGYTEPCSYSDIERLQNLINNTQHTKQLIMRMRDTEFLDYLVDNYLESTEQLSLELDKHLKLFEQEQTNNLNQSVAEKLQSSHRTKLYQQLKKQEIPIRADYSTNNYTFRKTIYSRKMRRELTLATFNIAKWHSGYADGVGIHRISGIGSEGHIANNQTLATNYIKQQSEQLKQTINEYVEKYGLENLLEHENIIRLFDGLTNNTKSIPCVILPTQPNLPILPSNQQFISFVPDACFNAQNLGIGEIVFQYVVDKDHKTFDLNILFYCYQNKDSLLLSSRKVAYDPLFYDFSEGVWWSMVGGKCSIDVNDLNSHGPWRTEGKRRFRCYADTFSYTPNLHNRTGLLDQPQLFIENLDYDSDAYHETLAKLNSLVEDKKLSLQKSWYKEIKHILKSDTESTLSKAFANFDVNFKLLKSALEIAIPPEQHYYIDNMLSTLCMFNDANQAQLFSGNRAAILKLLEQAPTRPLAKCLPTKQQINGLKSIINNYVNYYLDSRYSILDQIEAKTMAVIEQYINTAEKDRVELTVITKEQKTSIKNLEKAFRCLTERLMSINPNDAEAVQNIQYLLQSFSSNQHKFLLAPEYEMGSEAAQQAIFTPAFAASRSSDYLDLDDISSQQERLLEQNINAPNNSPRII